PARIRAMARATWRARRRRGVPILICQTSFERASTCLATLEGMSKGGPDVLAGLNELAIAIDAGYNAARLFSGVHPSEAQRAESFRWSGRFTELCERASSSSKIHSLLECTSVERLDAQARRYREFALRRGRVAGAALGEREARELASLRREITALEQEFVA